MPVNPLPYCKPLKQPTTGGENDTTVCEYPHVDKARPPLEILATPTDNMTMQSRGGRQRSIENKMTSEVNLLCILIHLSLSTVSHLILL